MVNDVLDVLWTGVFVLASCAKKNIAPLTVGNWFISYGAAPHVSIDLGVGIAVEQLRKLDAVVSVLSGCCPIPWVVALRAFWINVPWAVRLKIEA